MPVHGSRFHGMSAAGILVAAAISLWAGSAKAEDTAWSIGEDADGCFVATNHPGMGVTYSADDQFLVFFAGGSGNATSPSPSVLISIGDFAERLPLKAIGDEGWLLHDSVSAESIRAFTAEVLKGTAGPITIRSADAGLDMRFDTADLQVRGLSFWQCVNRQPPTAR